MPEPKRPQPPRQAPDSKTTSTPEKAPAPQPKADTQPTAESKPEAARAADVKPAAKSPKKADAQPPAQPETAQAQGENKKAAPAKATDSAQEPPKVPPAGNQGGPAKPKRGGLWWIVGGLALALIGGGVALGAALHVPAGVLAPGVQVGGVDVGGLDVEEARAQLAAQLPPAPVTTVTAGDEHWEVKAKDLGWSRNEAQALEQAQEFSQQRGWQSRLGDLVGKATPHDFPVTVSVNEQAAASKLAELAKPLEIPAEDGEIKFDAGKYAYTVVGGRDGKAADVKAAAKAYAQNPAAGTLALKFEPQVTPKSPTSLQKRVDEGNALLRSITVKTTAEANSGEYPLTKRQIANFFWATPEGIKPDTEAIDASFKQLAGLLNHPATPARFVRQGGKWLPKEGEAGEEIDMKEARAIFERDVLNPEAKESVWPSHVQQPTFTIKDLPDPKALELVATGDSEYDGSSKARRENIRIAAEKLDGYVIPPDADFSFLQAIGSISVENGFVDGLIISGGQTVDGLGGGVCQVSTTAFRGLYKAGLPIVERNQHSYRVPYYEPQTGFEAAVYDPGLDLKMHNDTGAPLVVKTVNDDPHSILKVELWGRNPGRKVEVSDAVITGRYPMPAPRYEVTRDLAPGQTRYVEGGRPGMKMYIERTIKDGGGTHKERLDTYYEPWGGIIQKGAE